MIKELRTYDNKKIKSMIVQLKGRLLENRFKLTQGELTDTSVFRETRKVIAQLLTILREREDRLLPHDWHEFGKISAEGQGDKVEIKKSRKNKGE